MHKVGRAAFSRHEIKRVGFFCSSIVHEPFQEALGVHCIRSIPIIFCRFKLDFHF